MFVEGRSPECGWAGVHSVWLLLEMSLSEFCREWFVPISHCNQMDDSARICAWGRCHGVGGHLSRKNIAGWYIIFCRLSSDSVSAEIPHRQTISSFLDTLLHLLVLEGEGSGSADINDNKNKVKKTNRMNWVNNEMLQVTKRWNMKPNWILLFCQMKL